MLEYDVGSLYEYYYNDLYRYVYIMTLNSFEVLGEKAVLKPGFLQLLIMNV